MNTDADGLTRISRINANEPMHADFLRGARAPRVQCSAPSRNTRELARRNAFDLTPTSLTSDFVGVFGTASHGTLIILHAVHGLTLIYAGLFSAAVTFATNWLALVPWRQAKGKHWTERARVYHPVRIAAGT